MGMVLLQYRSPLFMQQLLHRTIHPLIYNIKSIELYIPENKYIQFKKKNQIPMLQGNGRTFPLN